MAYIYNRCKLRSVIIPVSRISQNRRLTAANIMQRALMMCALALSLLAVCSSAGLAAPPAPDRLIRAPAPRPLTPPTGPTPVPAAPAGAKVPAPPGPETKGDLKGSESYYWPGYYGYYPYSYGYGYYPYSYGYYPSYYYAG